MMSEADFDWTEWTKNSYQRKQQEKRREQRNLHKLTQALYDESEPDEDTLNLGMTRRAMKSRRVEVTFYIIPQISYLQ